MLKAGELKDLGRYGVQTVPVKPQDQQSAGQIVKAAIFQKGDAIVIHVPKNKYKV